MRQIWFRDYQNEINTAVITQDGKYLLAGTLASRTWDGTSEVVTATGVPGTVIKIDMTTGYILGNNK